MPAIRREVGGSNCPVIKVNAPAKTLHFALESSVQKLAGIGAPKGLPGTSVARSQQNNGAIRGT
jgi:hypothetical protein